MSCPSIPPGEPPPTLDHEIIDVAAAVIAVHGDNAFQKARALFREMMDQDDIWAASAAHRVMQAIAALRMSERDPETTLH